MAAESSEERILRLVLRILLPVIVLGAGIAGGYGIYLARPEAETTDVQNLAPLVEVETLQPESIRLDVEARGTVRARTESALVAEVAGRVVEIAPSLEAGAFFDQDDVLVKIEKRDYELAVVRANAEIAQAKQARDIERAEAEAAVEEWKSFSEEPPPELVRRVPQLAAADARVEAADAALESAKRDLARTEVRAPYAGRVRSKQVDVGQFVVRGTVLARLYAVDYAEVRLPLHDRDLEFVDIPIDFRGRDQTGSSPEVTITARFGGQTHEWQGHIVRTEGQLDDTSRMLHAIARIDDPYGRVESGSKRPPLLVGMFVTARIQGRRADDVFVVPRHALRGEDRVLIIGDENRITVRQVEILRTDGETVYVRGGVQAGERLCTTRLEIYSEQMLVRVAGDKEKENG